MAGLPAGAVMLRWDRLDVRGRFSTFQCFWSNFSLHLKNNEFYNAVFKNSKINPTFN